MPALQSIFTNLPKTSHQNIPLQKFTKYTINDLIRYIPSVIIPTLLGFVALAIYTRHLSPREYGLYTLVFSTSLFLEVIIFNWLNQSVLRYYQRYKSTEIQKFYSTCLFGFIFIAIALTAIAYSALVGLNNYFDPRLRDLLYYLPLVVVCQSGCKFMLIFLRANRESSRYSFQLSVNSLIKLACALMLIYIFDLSAEAILLGIAIAGALIFFSETSRLARQWHPKLRYFSKAVFKSFARYGFPLLGLAIISLILSVSDRYLIQFIKGPASVGIYSAGYKIAETGITGLVLFLSLASFPALIEAFETEGQTKATALMKDLLGIYIILLTPAVIGVTVLSGEIIEIMLGGSFQEAYLILPWIAAGKFFMGLCPYYSKSFELKERTMILPAIYAGPALLNILLNIGLIPSFGIKGAAFSTCLSSLLCLIAIIFYGKRFIEWPFPWTIFLKAFAASLLMGAIVYNFPDLEKIWLSLVIKIIAGFVIYLTAIICCEKRILTVGHDFLKKNQITQTAPND
jgi:O-antigen/teichoic acid export membrane protein